MRREILRARAAAALARGVRGLRPALYWRALARMLPPRGVSMETLLAEVDALLRASWPAATTLPLPQAALDGRALIYETHELGACADADAFARLLRGIASADDRARLLRVGLAFDRPTVPKHASTRVLVLSPHRDDAPLALGGLLAQGRARAVPFVVNVFTVSGWLGEGFEARTVPRVTALRAAEDRLSSSLLGARSLDLGWWEIDLWAYRRRALEAYPLPRDFRFQHVEDLRPASERARLAHTIAELTRRVAPSIVYAPLGVGGHSDHLALRDATFDALPALDPKIGVRLYEDQPYASYAAVSPEELAAKLGRSLTPELIDVTEGFERKLQAIAAHRSQFSRAENEERLTRYAMGLGAGFGAGRLAERVWRLER